MRVLGGLKAIFACEMCLFNILPVLRSDFRTLTREAFYSETYITGGLVSEKKFAQRPLAGYAQHMRKICLTYL